MDKKQRNLSRILYLSGVECCPRRITDPPLFRSWFSLLLEVPTGWTWIAPPLKLTGIVKARLISFLWTPRPIVADKTVSMFMIWSWQNPRLRKQASKGVIQAFPVNKGARNTCKRFFFFFRKKPFFTSFRHKMTRRILNYLTTTTALRCVSQNWSKSPKSNSCPSAPQIRKLLYSNHTHGNWPECRKR